MEDKRIFGLTWPYFIMGVVIFIVTTIIMCLLFEFKLYVVVLSCFMSFGLVETWQEEEDYENRKSIFPTYEEVEQRRRELRKQNERQKDE